MATILQNLLQTLEEKSDPRTRGLLLATNPIPLAIILISYLYFCTSWGPNFMKDRKPFALKNTLIAYNAFQVLFSVYLCLGGWFAGWHDWPDFFCQPIDTEDNASSRAMHHVAHCYYLAKITELLDTVFFVLRKKDNQVTFLHLYHHATMPIFSYFGLRYFPNGHGTLFGIMNSFVHIVMYTYYLIAGLGPQYQKYLWWKKHVTTIQLVQFFLIFAHNFPPLFSSCTYPKFLHVILCTDAAFFFYMFGKFYIKNYLVKNKSHLNGSANGKVKARID
ncbi:elongation of very long chain fatty acids protein AAEL008004-like [Pectinophora gossypiella]|uniref:elongation of very long chain fatty acids protein AAEL008004-like n=1 Tax=Pectinophora gossypiella TaxID=13191 RepID=UPI00214E5C34|nr:elongation of very long chain fatty acids protein AAEL008004-like [Pectinophora gossypiella]